MRVGKLCDLVIFANVQTTLFASLGSQSINYFVVKVL